MWTPSPQRSRLSACDRTGPLRRARPRGASLPAPVSWHARNTCFPSQAPGQPHAPGSATPTIGRPVECGEGPGRVEKRPVMEHWSWSEPGKADSGIAGARFVHTGETAIMRMRPGLDEIGLGTGKKSRHRILFRHGLGNGTAIFLSCDQGLEHLPGTSSPTQRRATPGTSSSSRPRAVLTASPSRSARRISSTGTVPRRAANGDPRPSTQAAAATEASAVGDG